MKVNIVVIEKWNIKTVGAKGRLIFFSSKVKQNKLAAKVRKIFFSSNIKSGQPSRSFPRTSFCFALPLKIHKFVLDDRRLKVRELADMVGISKSAIHRILTENLDMRKLCARWVPRLLKMEQKQRLECVSIECLAMFHSNKADFSRLFITMNETWVYHFTPETKEQSKKSTERGESALKWAKTAPYAGKVIASVFWDACGMIFTDFVQ